MNAEDPICQNCGQRTGTVVWGDSLAITHGRTTMWCDVCMLREQFRHAQDRAAAIPELLAQLADALAKDPDELPDPRRTCVGENAPYWHTPVRVDKNGQCEACSF